MIAVLGIKANQGIRIDEGNSSLGEAYAMALDVFEFLGRIPFEVHGIKQP